jgi:hypothetical protein
MNGLPGLTGSPLFVRALPRLSAHRGKLLSGQAKRGIPVHAASFIRRREIVLESELLTKDNLPLIFVHEIFHFVWVRLGNGLRTSYAALLAEEQRCKARGEVGESAMVKKAAGKYSKDYVCESFCDTAAWLYARGVKGERVTLAQRWRVRRKAWFDGVFGGDSRHGC